MLTAGFTPVLPELKSTWRLNYSNASKHSIREQARHLNQSGDPNLNLFGFRLSDSETFRRR